MISELELQTLINGSNLLCGVDEVGRGSLFGDVVSAAVILNRNQLLKGLADSKKISEKKREHLIAHIQDSAVAWSIGRASSKEIDEINILQASLLAMRRAIEGLVIQPNLVLVDGLYIPNINFPAYGVVKGDQKVDAISAASIVAKVIRDREMKKIHHQYPEYHLDQNKGYPTKDHINALRKFGVTSLHRQTFKPVMQFL